MTFRTFDFRVKQKAAFAADIIGHRFDRTQRMKKLLRLMLGETFEAYTKRSYTS
jgi:hypothetical protein